MRRELSGHRFEAMVVTGIVGVGLIVPSAKALVEDQWDNFNARLANGFAKATHDTNHTEQPQVPLNMSDVAMLVLGLINLAGGGLAYVTAPRRES